MSMIIHELPGNIFYIENAFEDAQQFIDNVEKYDKDPDTYDIIPKWIDWYDSVPEKDSNGDWIFIKDNFTKGKQKLFDWDRTISEKNRQWPRPELLDLDEQHKLLESTIEMINTPYLKMLDIWCEKTGNKKLDYVSKNYMLRKYRVGSRIGAHIDKNIENPLNTMDWSVLFYLNDNYSGGELEFPELDITIKPSAGSAIFLPCTQLHRAKTVTKGQKYYIFMVIHSEFGTSTGLTEEYHTLNPLILKYKGIDNHPILDFKYPDSK